MNRRTQLLIFIFSLGLLSELHAQNDSTTAKLIDEFARLEAEMDTLGMFGLIDSLLQTEGLFATPKSELNIRFGYNSNILNAGRNYTISQHGFIGNSSYYHKSGIFADVSSYWNSATTPKYHLTTAAVGFLKPFAKKWSSSLSYDRWFYNNNSDSDNSYYENLTNGINASIAYSQKHFSLYIDYNFLFGKEVHSHRIISNLSSPFKFKEILFFDYIKLLPSASLIFGNELVVTTQYDGDFLYYLKSEQVFSDREHISTIHSLLADEEKEEIRKIRSSSDNKNKRTEIREIYLNNDAVNDYLNDLFYESDYEYGIMNYSFSLPIILNIKQFSSIISYTYSIPVSLPGETSELSSSSYFACSLSYRIPFRD